VATIRGAQGFRVQLRSGLMRTKDRTTSVPLALKQSTTGLRPVSCPVGRQHRWGTKKEKKTSNRMNSVNQFEDSASRSRGKHEGESSNALCDRLSRTRDTSPRQLPTDHDHAVPTREYQTDQSSLRPAPAAAGPVLDQRRKQRQKQHHECAGVDRSLHIRAI
jgi:hypothetical protein